MAARVAHFLWIHWGRIAAQSPTRPIAREQCSERSDRWAGRASRGPSWKKRFVRHVTIEDPERRRSGSSNAMSIAFGHLSHHAQAGQKRDEPQIKTRLESLEIGEQAYVERLVHSNFFRPVAQRRENILGPESPDIDTSIQRDVVQYGKDNPVGVSTLVAQRLIELQKALLGSKLRKRHTESAGHDLVALADSSNEVLVRWRCLSDREQAPPTLRDGLVRLLFRFAAHVPQCVRVRSCTSKRALKFVATCSGHRIAACPRDGALDNT